MHLSRDDYLAVITLRRHELTLHSVTQTQHSIPMLHHSLIPRFARFDHSVSSRDNFLSPVPLSSRHHHYDWVCDGQISFTDNCIVEHCVSLRKFILCIAHPLAKRSRSVAAIAYACFVYNLIFEIYKKTLSLITKTLTSFKGIISY